MRTLMFRAFPVAAVASLMALFCAQPVKVHAATNTARESSRVELSNFTQAIRKLYDLKEQAWAAGDAESIVTKFYSADAISVGEGDPQTMVGREQFRKAYQQYVKDVPSVRVESVRSYVSGNAGWDWANFYSNTKPDKKSLYPPSPIRIVFLWAKEQGQWICKGDIFVNGKLPPLP